MTAASELKELDELDELDELELLEDSDELLELLEATELEEDSGSVPPLLPQATKVARPHSNTKAPKPEQTLKFLLSIGKSRTEKVNGSVVIRSKHRSVTFQ